VAASLRTFARHLWFDADDSDRLVSPAAQERLTAAVAASERQHSGEIRLCIEASLPLACLWRVGRERSLPELIRERAVTLFGKLGVWDTAQNNGVLIYVLLAEHAIEVIADRGLNAHVSSERWSDLVARMGESFRQQHFEAGLMLALNEVSAELSQHFAWDAADGTQATEDANELPDAPTML
jgi:uncharacterized membrane protein